MLSDLPVEIVDSICNHTASSGLKSLMETCKVLHSPAKRRFYTTITLTSSERISAFHEHLVTLVNQDGTFKGHISPTKSLYLQCGWRMPRGMGGRRSDPSESSGAEAARRIIELLSPYLEILVVYRMGCSPRPTGYPMTTFPNLRKLTILEQNIIRLDECLPILQNITHLYVGWDILHLETEYAPSLKYLRVDQSDTAVSRSVPEYTETHQFVSIVADLAEYRSMIFDGCIPSHESQAQYEERIGRWKKWMGEKGTIHLGDATVLFNAGLRMMPAAWAANGLECAWDKSWNPTKDAKPFYTALHQESV